MSPLVSNTTGVWERHPNRALGYLLNTTAFVCKVSDINSQIFKKDSLEQLFKVISFVFILSLFPVACHKCPELDLPETLVIKESCFCTSNSSKRVCSGLTVLLSNQEESTLFFPRSSAMHKCHSNQHLQGKSRFWTCGRCGCTLQCTSFYTKHNSAA